MLWLLGLFFAILSYSTCAKVIVFLPQQLRFFASVLPISITRRKGKRKKIYIFPRGIQFLYSYQITLLTHCTPFLFVGGGGGEFDRKYVTFLWRSLLWTSYQNNSKKKKKVKISIIILIETKSFVFCLFVFSLDDETPPTAKYYYYFFFKCRRTRWKQHDNLFSLGGPHNKRTCGTFILFFFILFFLLFSGRFAYRHKDYFYFLDVCCCWSFRLHRHFDLRCPCFVF